MEVVAPGFQTFRQTGIAIDASQTARIDFTLQPGALEQSVTISADYVGRHQLHRQAVTAARTAAAISIDPCVSPSLWIPPSLTAYATAAYHPANTLISSSL